MTPDYDYGVQTSNNCDNFVVFSLLCSYYVSDIKKLELHLLVVIILFKMEFRHVQIGVPKIGKPMMKTACINPCKLLHLQNKSKSLYEINILR